MVTSQNLLDEIVVNASRVPERLFESTVTVEKFDFKDIAQSTGPDFYTSLQGLKGVQVNQGGREGSRTSRLVEELAQVTKLCH